MRNFMNTWIVAFTAAIGSAVAANTAIGSIEWQAYAFREGNTFHTMPTATELPSGVGVAFSAPDGGQKAAYGTTAFDGWKLGQFVSVDFTQVSPTAPVTYPPYLNIWITDGVHYAMISTDGDYRGTDLANRTAKLYENSAGTDWSWLPVSVPSGFVNGPIQISPGNYVTWAALANLSIGVNPSYTGNTAPTLTAFNIIWGDSTGNYIGDYTLDNLQVTTVPEAASLSLLVLGAAALLMRSKK